MHYQTGPSPDDDNYFCTDCGTWLYEEEVIIFRHTVLCMWCAEKSINNELEGARATLEAKQ